MSESQEETISASVKDQIERNRQRALAIKQSKLIAHPYSRSKTTAVSIDKNTIKIGATKFKDTGGGFLLEEPSVAEKEPEIVLDEPPVLGPDRPNCEKCEKPISNSWLFDTFDYPCCDDCKDEEIHKLITKTEALNIYLLKDCDLEKREPVLRFITRKNPHNVRWGEMKLYLRLQVEDRAMAVWGSEENIEREREAREEKKVAAKGKKYQKHMKDLRMKMRSSLFDRTTGAAHSHEFGPESYNEEDDTYSKACQTCSYTEIFEKM